MLFLENQLTKLIEFRNISLTFSGEDVCFDISQSCRRYNKGVLFICGFEIWSEESWFN